MKNSQQDEKRLLIDVSRVDAEGDRLEGEVECVNVNEEFVKSFGGLRYRLEAQVFGTELLLRGHLEQDFDLVCSRCGKDFDDTIKVEDYTASFEIPENSSEIDVTDDLREAVLLALPNYPKCSEDCTGLEQTEEVPPDSRWSALDSLKSVLFVALSAFAALHSVAVPEPNPAMMKRIREGVEIIGIVHWGLNTFTDKEWGFGDEKPEWLDPDDFSADQIVGACRDGGIQGLVIVAKHHDGFCLWPTKTTSHNITKSPFRGGKGDYVGEMCAACRKAGVKFGVYCSPWDRNNADYASEKYVKTYHAQVMELNDGRYGEIFEMWFDGANGGDGWYGGAAGPKGERRKIPEGYYRFDQLFPKVRALQPGVTFFGMKGEFAWPGNEQGFIDPVADPSDETIFRMWEGDFPLRPGWFFHEKERGRTRHGAYLMKLYLSTVGNGGIMNIGIAPDKHGRLDAEDVKALRDFKIIKDAFFSKPVLDKGKPYNVVVERRNWRKYIHVLYSTMSLRYADRHQPEDAQVRRYFVDPKLIKLVVESTASSGETDTAKWMTAGQR